MKKIFIVILLFFSFFTEAQTKIKYVRWQHVNTAQRDAIDVSDASVTYEVYNIDTQRKEHYNSVLGLWSSSGGASTASAITAQTYATISATNVQDWLEELKDELDALAIGAGAVNSVNGQAGTVVLDADDIAETATRAYLTPTEKSNFNTAYSWGDHAGLYKPIGYVPAWADITGKPTFFTPSTLLADYGVTPLTNPMTGNFSMGGYNITNVYKILAQGALQTSSVGTSYFGSNLGIEFYIDEGGNSLNDETSNNYFRVIKNSNSTTGTLFQIQENGVAILPNTEIADISLPKSVLTKEYGDANYSGDVTKVGTPVNNQIGVWTGDGTIKGTSGFTYDDGLLSVPVGAVSDEATLKLGAATISVNNDENTTITFSDRIFGPAAIAQTGYVNKGQLDDAIAGVSSGATNLTTTQTSTTVIINSDTGTDATIPLANGTNAGVSINNYTSAEKTKLATNVSPDVTFVDGTIVTVNVSLEAEAFISTGGASTDFLKADGSWDGNSYQAFDPLTHQTPIKWVGTQAQYDVDFPSGHGTREVWITDAPAPALTVSDISDLTATATELNYSDGVTSNIQTQLNAKNSYPSGDATKVGYISVTQAVDLDTMESDIATNNAKVSNATHTGDVTGSTTLTIDPTAVSGKTLKSTLTGTEEVLINDAGTLKKTTAQDIADLGGGGNSSTIVEPFTITNGVISGGTYTLNLLSGVTGKIYSIRNLSVVAVGMDAGITNNSNIYVRYNGDGANLAGDTFLLNGGGSSTSNFVASYTRYGDFTGAGVDIVITNASDQTLTGTIHGELVYTLQTP